MFKFRELVRMGNQAGIPENLRAQAEPIERTTKAVKGHKAKILAYIAQHEGEEIGYEDLLKVTGHKSRSAISHLLEMLVREGKVRKWRSSGKETNGGGLWRLSTVQKIDDLKVPELDPGDSKNSPVTTKYLTPRVPIPEREAAPVATPPMEPAKVTIPMAAINNSQLERDLAELKRDVGGMRVALAQLNLNLELLPPRIPETPTAPLDLDSLAWRFVKAHTYSLSVSTTQAVELIARFTDFVNKETNNGPDQSSAAQDGGKPSSGG